VQRSHQRLRSPPCGSASSPEGKVGDDQHTNDDKNVSSGAKGEQYIGGTTAAEISTTDLK
jgi:hypothetical protein